MFEPSEEMCDRLISHGFVVVKGPLSASAFKTFVSSVQELFEQSWRPEVTALGPFDSGFHPLGRSKMREGPVPNFVESWMFDCARTGPTDAFLSDTATASLVSMGVSLKTVATSFMKRLD